MNHLETATEHVQRHLRASKPRLVGKTCRSDWKDAHEAAAKYLKLKPYKVTRK